MTITHRYTNGYTVALDGDGQIDRTNTSFGLLDCDLPESRDAVHAILAEATATIARQQAPTGAGGEAEIVRLTDLLEARDTTIAALRSEADRVGRLHEAWRDGLTEDLHRRATEQNPVQPVRRLLPTARATAPRPGLRRDHHGHLPDHRHRDGRGRGPGPGPGQQHHERQPPVPRHHLHRELLAQRAGLGDPGCRNVLTRATRTTVPPPCWWRAWYLLVTTACAGAKQRLNSRSA